MSNADRLATATDHARGLPAAPRTGTLVTGMDDLVTWLRARLDEDERTASGARPGRWATRTDSIGTREVYSATRDEALGGDSNVFPDAWHEGSAEHAARWDPARVLAEVDARRQRLDWIVSELADDPTNETAQWLAKLEAAPFADRDGWRTEWRAEEWRA